MKYLDDTLLIFPSLIRMFSFCVVSQFPIYIGFYAALNTSNQEYECLDDGIFSILSQFLIPVLAITCFAIAMVIANRRVFLIELGGKNSLAPNVLKGAGNRRIDLNKEYLVEITRLTLRFTQDKNKITLYRLMYSRSDLERLLSFVKI